MGVDTRNVSTPMLNFDANGKWNGMGDAGSYDLLARKGDWKAKAVLIVSPYVEEHFFRKVAADLHPKRMHVVIDDGCRREDLQTVTDAVTSCGRKRVPVLRCKLGSARGLVHIKLFYVVWETTGGRAAHSMVFGSANATRQGFSGSDNAELVVSAKLTASGHSDIIRWCKDVMEATETDEVRSVPMVRDAMLARGMSIRLPAIVVGRTITAVSNFDLWIQRGRLLSDYRPDPGFLHVPLQLARGLPPAELARLAEGEGFAVRQTKSLRYRYVAAPVEFGDEEDEPAESEATEIGNWRRKLFVWTNLGDWCSDACFEANEASFRRRGYDDRVLALEQLRALGEPAGRAAAKARFLTRVAALWDRFGDAAPTLLKGRTDLDRGAYEELFDQRVERDLALADDREYRDRFVRGFELVEVPRFRNDVAGWRSFVESFATQLVLDASRGRSQSMLLKAVREAFGTGRVGHAAWRDHRALVAALRELWQREQPRGKGPTVTVERYHLPPAM